MRYRAELSALYFQLAYPAPESEFGHMIVALGSADGNVFSLSDGVLGGQDGTHLDIAQELRIKRESYFYTYTTEGQDTYIGLHRKLPFAAQDGGEMTVAVLVPEQSYRSAASLNRMAWIGGSLAFLLAMLALAMFFSRRFVKPIVQSLEAIQRDTSFPEGSSGISEIDELMAFFQSKAGQTQPGDELPPKIEAFFSDFLHRVEQLTPMERTVLQYYIDGYKIEEIAARAFISVNTAKKHNTNINRKLGVTTREELMLYIDLFRRCGRLEQIAYHI